MEQITEDYVSFETAKLLKEKGFDEDIARVVNEEGEIDYLGSFQPSLAYLHHTWYRCPTLQMAMKWLREVHNIAIETEWEHLWYAYIKPMTSKPSEEDYYQCESSKYEEACENAIKYCLTNLV